MSVLFHRLDALRSADRIGTRRGLSLTVACYSVISILTSLARGFYSFATFRFLLGAGASCTEDCLNLWKRSEDPVLLLQQL